MSQKFEILNKIQSELYTPFNSYYQKKLDEMIADNAELTGEINSSAIKYEYETYRATLSTPYSVAANLHESLKEDFKELIDTHNIIKEEQRQLSFRIRNLFNKEDDIEQLLAMLPESVSHLHSNRKFRVKDEYTLKEYQRSDNYEWLDTTTKRRILANNLLE